MKKNSLLLSEAKNFSGNVLGIGDIDDKLVDILNKNDSVNELNIISKKNYNMGSCSGKTKKITLKNLRKFKKKKVNYLIVDYDNINNYLKTFIKDSIYITKEYIYFVTNDKKIVTYYRRYKTQIKEVKCSDKSIYIIDTRLAKNNKIKEFIYSIVDTISKLIDLITNLLLS